MHRIVVTVFAALLLVALGASLGVAKDEDEEKRKMIAEVILLSGVARGGEIEAEKLLDYYRAIEDDEHAPEELKRGARMAVPLMEPLLTAEEYALYLAPLYVDSMTTEEAVELATLLRSPLFAKWMNIQKEFEKEEEDRRAVWKDRMSRLFIQCYVQGKRR